MARTSLLLALALSPAALALGVTKPPCSSCPAKEVCDDDERTDCDSFLLPVGQCGDRQDVGSCGSYFTCEISEWEFVAEPPSCDDSDVACNDRNGDWNPPLAGECCGTCSIPPK